MRTLAIIIAAVLCAKCTGSEWSPQDTAHCASSLELRDKNCDFYGASSATCKEAQNDHLRRCSSTRSTQGGRAFNRRLGEDGTGQVLEFSNETKDNLYEPSSSEYLSSLVEEQKHCPASKLLCPRSSDVEGLPMNRSDGKKNDQSAKDTEQDGEPCDGRLGYIDPNMSNMSNITKNKWQEGLWSRTIPVGFAGNSQRAEQYQIAPPGCPANCSSKSMSQTSFEALKDSSCAATQTGLGHVTVSAGGEHTCATTQAGVLACWGQDSGSQAADGVVKLREQGITEFSSISAGEQHTCGVNKTTELLVCWGRVRSCVDISKSCVDCWRTQRPGVYRSKSPDCLLIRLSYQNSQKCASRCGDTPQFTQATVPTEYKDTKFSSVSCGDYHTCGLIKETKQVVCWDYGWARHQEATVPDELRNIKFSSVSAGTMHTCGITKEAGCSRGNTKCKRDTRGRCVIPKLWVDTRPGRYTGRYTKHPGIDFLAPCTTFAAEQVVCWGSGSSVSPDYEDTKFRSVSVSKYDTCGVIKETELAVCWPKNCIALQWPRYCTSNHKQLTVPPEYKDTKFNSLSAGMYHTCGVIKETELVGCWGSDRARRQNGGWGVVRWIKFKDNRTTVPAQFKNIKFRSVSAGNSHTCGVTKEAEQVVCWGSDLAHNGPITSVPKNVKWIEEASCLTSHPVISGPASCTSCDPGACNKHFTIIDPKTNTGTCTQTECPFCKPKECCGAGHKHYVLNTENLEGVCVRHNDDCTPVCVPYGSNDPGVKRVCSKGCNRLLKIVRNQSAIKSEHLETSRHHNATTEGDLFDLVVCQADKRVVCDPTKQSSKCRLEAEFTAQAVCRFSPELWNLGATCIKNHVHRDTHPQCADGASHKMINRINGATQTRQWTTTRGLCQNATLADSKFCQTLAIVY